VIAPERSCTGRRPDGTIEDVQPLSSTVSDEVTQCAVGVLEAASFPEHPREEPDEYGVPLLLDPALRAE
jgi:hypothetical protein